MELGDYGGLFGELVLCKLPGIYKADASKDWDTKPVTKPSTYNLPCLKDGLG